MSGITPDMIGTTIKVILAIFGGLITVDKIIDIVKKWRKPGKDTAVELDDHEKHLQKHDEAIKDLQRANQALCSGVLALLEHELHDGNSEQMEDAKTEIMDYLKGKITH